MGTGVHYITMLPADWSSHDPLPSSCHSEKMLWNPSIGSLSSSTMSFGGILMGSSHCLTEQWNRLEALLCGLVTSALYWHTFVHPPGVKGHIHEV